MRVAAQTRKQWADSRMTSKIWWMDVRSFCVWFQEEYEAHGNPKSPFSGWITRLDTTQHIQGLWFFTPWVWFPLGPPWSFRQSFKAVLVNCVQSTNRTWFTNLWTCISITTDKGKGQNFACPPHLIQMQDGWMACKKAQHALSWLRGIIRSFSAAWGHVLFQMGSKSPSAGSKSCMWPFTQSRPPTLLTLYPQLTQSITFSSVPRRDRRRIWPEVCEVQAPLFLCSRLQFFLSPAVDDMIIPRM